MASTDSWYEATAARSPLPSLRERLTCETLVVGGGLAGLGIAHELARLGRHTALIESRSLAWGASGRNGGFVSAGFAEGMDAVEKRVGLAAARELYRLSAEGSDFVRAHSAGAVTGEGKIVTSRKPGDFDAYCDRMNRTYGARLESWNRERIRGVLHSNRYHAAFFNVASFHIHPLRYAFSLAAAAARHGARLFENSAALAIERDGAGFRVRTAEGVVECRDVVVCVSALDRRLHRPTARAVLPVATYVAVTEPLSQTAINTRAAISDTRRAGDYYRLVDEGRLLWGGRITTRISEPRRLAEAMRRDMLSVYPQLGAPSIDFAWAGLMGYALHKMPLIGRGPDGIWYATAFGGHGLNTTAMAGLLLSRAIAAGDDEYRRFEPFKAKWAGGPFGRAGVQASYWWMQALDLVHERHA